MEYIVNERGERTKVVLDVSEYERLREAAEDAEDIRLYDEAKASIKRDGSERIPFAESRRQREVSP